MACPAIHSGQSFLASVLSHVDCQAQTIGSYGYGALADPGSPVSHVLASLLTIFVALFGFRLLLGHAVAGRDVVTDVLKVGIVLTLATSWPAWRVLGYDLLIHGPSEIAHAIGLASGLPGSSGDMMDRLQRIDDGLAALNLRGSGRLGVATGDWFQLGFARSTYLAGTLVPVGLVRLSAGLLLALAPVMAGLLLFGVTRAIFAGWIRAMVMTFLASVGICLTLGAELAVLEPWLQDALNQRAADQQVLDAPVEVLVITLSFALISLGMVAVLGRVAFHPGTFRFSVPQVAVRSPDLQPVAVSRFEAIAHGDAGSPGGRGMALSIADSIRREERFNHAMRPGEPSASRNGASGYANTQQDNSQALGSSWRRGTRRVSRASNRRDQAQ